MSCNKYLPYYPLTNDTVRDAAKVNADLCALVTGIEAGTGAGTGATGIQWVQESCWPTGMEAPLLLWNTTDEALYAYVTGLYDNWVQISAGSAAGATGLGGPTGLANWMVETPFPTGMDTPVLLWNQADEALYAYVTGPDRWVQISAGMGYGPTGLQGPTGVQGTDSFDGLIEAPSNKSYTLCSYAPIDFTLETLSILTYAGTCTASITKNGVGVSGLWGLSVSSTRTNATATGNNDVSTNDRVALLVSSVSSPVDLEWTLKESV